MPLAAPARLPPLTVKVLDEPVLSSLIPSPSEPVEVTDWKVTPALALADQKFVQTAVTFVTQQVAKVLRWLNPVVGLQRWHRENVGDPAGCFQIFVTQGRG